MSRRVALRWEDRTFELELELRTPNAALVLDGRRVEATIRRDGDWIEVRQGDRAARCASVADARGAWVALDGRTYRLARAGAESAARAGAGTDEIRAPMTGRVVLVAAKAGAAAREGDLLVMIEAMKMEFRLTAPEDGRILEVACAEGDRVELGQVLVRLEPAAAGASGRPRGAPSDPP